MNTKQFFITSTLISLFLAAAGIAQLPEPFSIASFNVTDNKYIERDNFVIKSPKTISPTDMLSSLDSPPPFIRPGQAVMRKKFGADYRLYIGELDNNAFRAFPPLFSFPLPSWSRTGQAMWYRFYTSPVPPENRNRDLDVVFFDNERIYVQHHSVIYFMRNEQWDSIASTAGPPYGSLNVDSEPQGAEIYLYGHATGQRTPAAFKNLIAGRYEVEVFLDDYRFRRRSVHVPAGGETSTSFQMLSDFDTLLVFGENQHGVLVLPYPPIDRPYAINDSAVTEFRHRLLEGEYRINWHGGGFYQDIDTVITIPPGLMVYFNVPFERLNGSATFILNPPDALICIEGFPCHVGGLTVELPSGFHTARVNRHGYEPEWRRFVISHGKRYTIRIALDIDVDRDRDGFPDSIDRCPDVWGLYDGCPRPNFKHMTRMKYAELNEYMETEPFSFSVAVMGYVSRSPTNRRFHNFLSSFSGGRPGGMNNYKGINIGNIYQVSHRGFMAQLELGQWLTGVKFRRPDTLTIKTENENYIVWYDSLYQIDPAVFFPSTAISTGFKYRHGKYSVGYSLGFQWEDIIIDEIQRVSDGEMLRVIFNNDWWFHEIMLEADLYTNTFFTPSLYAKFKFPFGPTMQTKWHVLQAGLQFRLRPIHWKERR